MITRIEIDREPEESELDNKQHDSFADHCALFCCFLAACVAIAFCAAHLLGML